MIRLVQRRLIIPRGDTGSFTLPVISSLNIGDVAVFTIFDTKRQAKIFQKIVEPENNALVIRFEHEDTVNLPIGKYFWDIKFYQNPVFIDEELVDGKEVDSYYAAFTVPECEVRQTGDNLLNADDAPDTTLSPESINFLEAIVNDANSAKQDAIESKDAAARSAQEAAGSADNASNYASLAEGYKNDAAGSAADALVSQGAAAGSASDASGSANAAAGSARDAADSASAAAGSASSAHDDAVAAANSKEAASRSAGLAANSASDAYRYSESANTDAGNAYNYASAAEGSASAANRDAGAAAASALEAAGYVNQITGLTATATQLASTASPTASYNSNTGILALGIPEGVGITSIVLNNDYTLTINLNNGQSVTTTSIRGPQGPQGDAFHIVKTYASIAAMNADYSGTDVEIGEFVMIVSNVDDPDNAKVYVKGDQQYNFIVDMSGSAGIEGPAGNGIASVSITYQGSSSNTTAPSGTWVDNPPNVAAGNYLWTRIIFTYTNSTTSAPFYSVAKQGEDYVLTEQDKEDIAALVDVPVTDVQINGTSILSDGVANVPIAGNDLGVVKVESGYGIAKNTSGRIYISGASESVIKAGSDSFSAIIPARQHASAFYGLAKAAGDSTQSASANAVGTYTDAAKVAIQKMLGIYQAPWELIREDTVTNETAVQTIVSADGNGEPFQLTDAKIVIWVDAQTPSPTIADYGRIWFMKGNDEIRVAYLLNASSSSPTAKRVGFCSVIRDNTALEVCYTEYSENAGHAIIRQTAVTDKNTVTTPFGLTPNDYFDKIKIGKITGTFSYILYGKRKWN